MRKQAGVDFVQTALVGLSKACHMAKNEIPGNSGNPAFFGNLTTVRLRMTRLQAVESETESHWVAARMLLQRHDMARHRSQQHNTLISSYSI